MYQYFIKTLSSFAVICNLLFISCINNIPEQMPEAGEIPISLTTSFRSMSRVTFDKFEKGDAIGLYIIAQPSSSIDQSRYVDNMKFSYDPLTGFMPEETIFYPEGNNKCNFISYYPYTKNAIKKGESTIKVEVHTDQSNNATQFDSDFMIATNSDVTASKNPVALDFHHKLFQLNIFLKPVSGYTDEMLLASNPTVKIKNVYTQATYNLKTNAFTDFSSKKDIIPHGAWKIENGMLCGKSAIIIPQTLPKSHIFLELYVENRLFECVIGDAYPLKSGVAEDNTITLQSSSDATQNTISTSISEWTTNEKQWEANEASTVLQTSKLDFTDSNVLKVMNKGKQMAEICLEYLNANEIKEQAVIIYPVKGGKTDLTKGLVIEVKGEEGNKHGGNVVWNTSTNSLTYTKGSSTGVPYIYIDENEEIRTIRPANALQIQLRPDLLAVHREEEIIDYPIVKIGTQYWTRGNYKNKKYTDGTDIAHGGTASTDSDKNTTVSNSTPQYYNFTSSFIFYNAACAATGNLVPSGWRVGNQTDFDQLRKYLQDNAVVLKNNKDFWNNNDLPVTNLTGFNGIGTGYFNKTYTGYKSSVAYWCASNGQPNVLDKIVTLSASDNVITIKDAIISDMALAIRCVRDE